MGILKFHGVLKSPWEIIIFLWDFEISHGKLMPWEFKTSHGIKDIKILWENLNNFPWEFKPVFLIILPATFEQVKSNAEPNIRGAFNLTFCSRL